MSRNGSAPRVRHGQAGAGTRRRLRAAAGCCDHSGRSGVGGQRVWSLSGESSGLPEPCLARCRIFERSHRPVRRDNSKPSPAGHSPFAIIRWPMSTLRDAGTLLASRDILAALPGVARVFVGEERAEIGLDHQRSGELIALIDSGCLVRVSILAGRRTGPGLCPRGGDSPQAGLRPMRIVFRSEAMVCKTANGLQAPPQETGLPDDYGCDSAGCFAGTRESWDTIGRCAGWAATDRKRATTHGGGVTDDRGKGLCTWSNGAGRVRS